MKIKFYSDPGHGWAAVKRKTLIDMGIIDKVSTYSYQRGQTVYLEEDCDLSLLIGALKAKELPVEFTDSHANKRSPIRSYETFKA